MLTQTTFASSIVELAGLQDTKPAPTPLPVSHCLYEGVKEVTEEEKFLMQDVLYRAVLGSLLYLSTRTRPDIATPVSMLAKFQSAPAPQHWKTMKHVVRYVKGAVNFSLRYRRMKSVPMLTACTDAYFAREIETRRSRIGCTIFLGGAFFSWYCKLQTTVAMFRTEPEFDALAVTVCEVIWAPAALKDLGAKTEMPTVIFEDKLVSIKWTGTVQGLRNVKQVVIKYQYVREHVQSETVEVRYTPTEQNRADMLTKALIGNLFRTHRKSLCVAEGKHNYVSLRGRVGVYEHGGIRDLGNGH